MPGHSQDFSQDTNPVFIRPFPDDDPRSGVNAEPPGAPNFKRHVWQEKLFLNEDREKMITVDRSKDFMIVRGMSPDTHEKFANLLKQSPREKSVDGKEFEPQKIIPQRNPLCPEYGEYALGRRGGGGGSFWCIVVWGR